MPKQHNENNLPMTNEPEYTQAHNDDLPIFSNFYPDGLVRWNPASPPSLTGLPDEQMTGRLRYCQHCGSMHPADLAAAIRAGASGSWADRKYGWPHKAYFHGIANPWAGQMESRTGTSNPKPGEEHKWRRVVRGYNRMTGEPEYGWRDFGTPASATCDHEKFYSVHLQDATPEDRDTIERHLGLRFEFMDDGSVRWRPVEP